MNFHDPITGDPQLPALMQAGLILTRRGKRYVVVDWDIVGAGHCMVASLVRLGRMIWPFRCVWTINDSQFDQFEIESIPRPYLGKPLPVSDYMDFSYRFNVDPGDISGSHTVSGLYAKEIK